MSLPSTLEIIGENVFQSTSITSIVIPSSVNIIEETAFSSCDKLTSVTFEDATGWYVLADKNEDFIDGTKLASTNLENTSTAATYLTSTYKSKYWRKQ